MSVPIAVVVSAEPVYSNDKTTPTMASAPPIVYASVSDSAQPSSASRSGCPQIRPGRSRTQRRRSAAPVRCRRRTDELIPVQAQHVRSDHDPEQQLDHHATGTTISRPLARAASVAAIAGAVTIAVTPGTVRVHNDHGQHVITLRRRTESWPADPPDLAGRPNRRGNRNDSAPAVGEGCGPECAVAQVEAARGDQFDSPGHERHLLFPACRFGRLPGSAEWWFTTGPVKNSVSSHRDLAGLGQFGRSWSGAVASVTRTLTSAKYPVIGPPDCLKARRRVGEIECHVDRPSAGPRPYSQPRACACRRSVRRAALAARLLECPSPSSF